jgi:hypothetical protein
LQIISDHQQSWGYEDGPRKGPGPPLLVAADSIHKPPASIRFAPIKHALAVSVEPFKFPPASPVAYELSKTISPHFSHSLSGLGSIFNHFISANSLF